MLCDYLFVRLTISVSFFFFLTIRALEAVLVSVTSSLQSEMEVLEAPVNKLLGDLEDVSDVDDTVQQKQLLGLLQFSKKLSKFEQDALSIHDVIKELLDNGNTERIPNPNINL